MPVYLYQGIISLSLIILLRKSIVLPKYFKEFLISVVLLEIVLANAFSYIFGNNVLIYNILVFTCISYYTYVFASNLKFLNAAKLIIIAYLALVVGDNFIWSNWNNFNNLSYTYGMIYISVLCVMYLYQLLETDFQNYDKDPLFYLSIGILLFYTSSFTILLLNPLLMQMDYSLSKDVYILVKFGNVILSLSYLKIALLNWKTRN